MEAAPLTLTTFDISFFVATLAISVMIGVYFANKNKSLDEYMLGGKEQKLLPVSISMMTSFISGLTLVGSPAELYYHGMGFSLVILGMILHLPFSSFILLPVFRQLESYSVFSYLELRYGKWIKRITSVGFMLQMTLYNAVVLYVPSMSLQSVLGISGNISIGLVGLSCLIYCTLGGIKAVIWTDFFQAGIMYFSLLCIVVRGTIEAGGLGQLISTNIEGQRLTLSEFFNLDIQSRHTIYNVCIGTTIINIFMNGANQIQVQRALSLPTLRQSQLSQLYASLFTMLISVICSYIGMIMYAVYKDCDPFQNKAIEKRDALLIYYVSTNLRYIPGLRGVFVAGIFAATLSTLSSFQNSMSALMLEDFIKPSFKRSPLSDRTATLLGKSIAFLFGVLCIGLTYIVGRISGLLQVAYTLFGSLGAPFISCFFLGMMTRFTNTCGATFGMLVGILLGITIQLYQTFTMPPLEPTMPISTRSCPTNLAGESYNITSFSQASDSFLSQGSLTYIARMSYLWLPAVSFVITTVVAILVSILTGGSNQDVDDKFLVSWLHKRRNGYYGDDSESGNSLKCKNSLISSATKQINPTMGEHQV